MQNESEKEPATFINELAEGVPELTSGQLSKAIFLVAVGAGVAICAASWMGAGLENSGEPGSPKRLKYAKAVFTGLQLSLQRTPLGAQFDRVVEEWLPLFLKHYGSRPKDTAESAG